MLPALERMPFLALRTSREAMRSTWTEAAFAMWLHFHFSRLVIRTGAKIHEKHNQPSPTYLCSPWALVSSSVDGKMFVG